MAKVNFNIRDNNSSSKSVIMLSFTYLGNRIRISTKEQVYPTHWNKRLQRVREIVDEPKAIEINNNLAELETLVIKVYQGYHKDGVIPQPKEFMQEIENQRRLPQLQNNNRGFWEYFEEFIQSKSKNTKDIRDFDKSLRKHLVCAEKKWGKTLTFSAIKMSENGFIEVMDRYLTFEAINSKGEMGLTTNTVGKQFKNLKVFLRWCFKNEHISSFNLEHLVTKTEEVDKIYLTQEEVDAIFALEGLEEEDETIRDLFIIGIETALRFSDFTRIKPHHIFDGKLSINPIKTEGKKVNNKIVLPVSPKFNAILQKRNGIPPQYNGKLDRFNKKVRRLVELAGIKDIIVIQRSIKGKITEELIEKYKLVSSHTCRRTFCTLMFLKGMPAQVIMKFSGHTTERNFLKYLKLNNEEAIKKYKHFFN
jgi:integrase